MSGEKNQSINCLKAISCIIVVFLHCAFPGNFGRLIFYASRFSVPVFFMISGYYSFQKPDAWIFKKMKTTLSMLVLFELLHGALLLSVRVLYYKESVSAFFLSLPSLQHPVRTLFFGTFFNGPMWCICMPCSGPG